MIPSVREELEALLSPGTTLQEALGAMIVIVDRRLESLDDRITHLTNLCRPVEVKPDNTPEGHPQCRSHAPEDPTDG